jgi:hypothetical protein
MIVLQTARDSRLSASAETHTAVYVGREVPARSRTAHAVRFTKGGLTRAGEATSESAGRGEHIGHSEGGKFVPGLAKIRLSEMGHIGRGQLASFETGCGLNDDTLVADQEID